MRKQIHITHAKKIVGYVLPDKRRYITERTQFLMKNNILGHSISDAIFDKLKKLKVKEIRVIFNKPRGCTAVYIATMETWLDNSIEHFFGLDRQFFLPVMSFDKVCE